ncbi:hypothetical protein B0H34DRAFT_629344, partial [Crassisporium funariophilum]
TKPPPPTALHTLKTLLRQVLRITTTDGRIFLGTFAGTDAPLNVVLVNAEEYRVRGGVLVSEDGRYVGQVLVPWRLVVRVE